LIYKIEVVNAPHIPTQLDQLGSRPFSFYPSIVGVEHNQWRLRRVTWTEVHVMNTKSDLEMWVPRHLVGEVSLIEEPVRIVGLVKELEYKAGALIPHRRRVLEMPRAVGDSPRAMFRPVPAENGPRVVGIRVEEGSRARRWRRVLGWIATGLLAFIASALAIATVGGHRRGLRTTDPFGHRVHR
jgi:hypothetical protein